MRKLFLCTTLLVISFTLCITAIRILNERNDSLASHILGADDIASDQACWYGICPGKTSIAQSVASLSEIAQRFSTTVTYGASNASTSYLAWYAACIEFQQSNGQGCILPYYGIEKSELRIELDLHDSGLSLGDIVVVLGNPVSTFMCSGVVPDSARGRNGVAVLLYYANGTVVEAYKFSRYNQPRYITPLNEWVISPDMVVNTISINPATPVTVQADGALLFPWRGFSRGSERRYSCGN